MRDGVPCYGALEIVGLLLLLLLLLMLSTRTDNGSFLHQYTRSRNIYSEFTIQGWGSSWTGVCYAIWPYLWADATAPGELSAGTRFTC